MKPAGQFTEGSILRHIAIMTMTSALGLTFTFFVDFLTLYWISKLNNSDLVASVGVAGSIMFLAISVSIAFMIPAVALVSRELGRGQVELARQHATASLLVSTAAMSLIALLCLLFLEPLLRIVGGDSTPEVIEFSRKFLIITLPSIPLFAIGMTASSILRAQGDGLRSMNVTFIGGIIAMVLDPLLIVYMHMDITGAAIVVVLTRVGMAALGLYYVTIGHNLLAHVRDIKFNGFIRPFFAIALPALLTQGSSPVGNIIMTRAIAPFGSDAQAGYSVNFRLMLLAFGGVFALSGAIGGIIGQNYGAGKFDRVREAYLKAIGFGAVYSLVTWVLLMIARPFVAEIFSLTPEAARIPDAFVWTAWYFMFVSAIFVSNAAFNNLGRPLYSTAVNWFRDVLITFPIVYFMAKGMGAVGVVYASVVVGILTGILASYIGWIHLGKVARGEIMIEGKRS